MPVISRIAIGVLVLATIALFSVSRLTLSYENLFMACPIVDATVPVERVDQLDLYLTYENAAMNLEATVISTNHAYRRVLGYSMLSGSFFTQNAQIEGRKTVVLNEKLAFDTFGGFEIEGVVYRVNGEPYQVVGVIDDGQARKNAYIPGLSTAGSFLAVIDTEEKTIADLRSIGVSDNRFHLVNISEVAQGVRNKPWFALMGLGVLVLVVLFYRTVNHLADLARALKQKNREEYLNRLLLSVEARQFAGLSLAALVEIAALLWLFLRSAEMVLQWAKYAGSLQGVNSLAFGGLIPDLHTLCLYSNIALGIYCGGALLGLIGIKRDQ